MFCSVVNYLGALKIDWLIDWLIDSLSFEYGYFISYITSLHESCIGTEVNTVQLHLKYVQIIKYSKM